MQIVLKIWKVQNHKYIDQAPKLCDEKVSVKNWLEKIEGSLFQNFSYFFNRTIFKNFTNKNMKNSRGASGLRKHPRWSASQ